VIYKIVGPLFPFLPSINKNQFVNNDMANMIPSFQLPDIILIKLL